MKARDLRQSCREFREATRHECVPGPVAPLLTTNESGLGQYTQVMGSRWLGKADGIRNIADARLAAGQGSQVGEQLQSRWVGNGLEQPGEFSGLVAIEGFGEPRGAALWQGN